MTDDEEEEEGGLCKFVLEGLCMVKSVKSSSNT